MKIYKINNMLINFRDKMNKNNTSIFRKIG